MNPIRENLPEGGRLDVDTRLALLAQRGDRWAAEELFTRLRKVLVRQAERWTREPNASEELAQEAVVRCWVALATFSPRTGGVLAWARKILTNLAISRWRSQRRSPERGGLLIDPASDRDDPAVLAEARENLDELTRLLDTLPEPLRRAVRARLAGERYVEIASQNEEPLGTIAGRVSRARRMLRRQLRRRKAA